MEFPLFRNPWNASSYPGSYEQSLRGIPVEVKPKAVPPQPLKPKVVSIPVHYVGSEQRRSESVIKIQKVFRGFLVRKNMNKIKAIREEVIDIERSVSKKETVDLIRNDSKERLKVNEMLMGLLLKLDSVRGVDSGVRDCRKSVIKKEIALQELVDAIVSGDQSNNADDDDDDEASDQSQGTTASADHSNQTSESQDHDDTTKDVESVPNFSESEANQETIEPETEAVNEESMERNGCQNVVKEEEEEEEEEAEEEAEARLDEEKGEKKRSMDMELVERMMEDNEKMMGLMTLLFEKNEMQTRMLNALSQRVEQLEKAILCDKSRRKKRKSAAASVDKK
ncbi:hypothetical protein PTKIN_Ptkin09bG0086000 [Pterospermum kingtungense]